jgi:hypothetical protein
MLNIKNNIFVVTSIQYLLPYCPQYYPTRVSLSTKQTGFRNKMLRMSLTLLCLTQSAEPPRIHQSLKNNLLLGTLENYI